LRKTFPLRVGTGTCGADTSRMKAAAVLAPASHAAVDVDDVVVRYDRLVALDGVSLHIERGTALGIVGPNGSGKSTLLKTIAGLIEPAAGTVRVFGQVPRQLPPGSIGYVPQIEAVDFSFPVCVRDVVSMGRYPRLAPLAPFRAADRKAVDQAIAALDLGAFANRHISELSGGQQQRVAVARALAHSSPAGCPC
jgi:manganese transport system ATP-binding protein